MGLFKGLWTRRLPPEATSDDPADSIPLTEDEALQIVTEASPARQHYINEMLTRAVGERIIKAGDTVIDVGANRGFHMFEFARLVGDSGLVHAFEPNPLHWHALSSLNNVRLWPFAAGDQMTVARFFAPPGHDNAASLHDPSDVLGQTDAVPTIDAVQVPIDTLLEIDRTPIVFIKLDVERHEYQALVGMRNLLVKHRPIIVLENPNTLINNFFSEIEFVLTPLTYSLWGNNDVQLPNVMYIPKEMIVSDTVLPAEVVLKTIEQSLQFG